MVATEGLFAGGQVERARRYHRPLYLAAAAGVTVSLGLLGLLSFTVVGDRVYGLTSGWPWWGRGLAFAPLIVAVTMVAGLPIGFWAGYLHEHAWALSTQSLRGWLTDRAKGVAVNLVLTTCVLVGFVAAARLWPAAWPVLVASAGAGLVLVLSFVAPVVLEPLFSRFAPLADPELVERLRLLAERAGVPVREVLVCDASRRTRKLNAYVSGLGSTRRLVLFDTLLADVSLRETELVVAHELGHRRRHHPVKAALLGMGGMAMFVLSAWALVHWPGLRSAIGAAGAGDPRILPFLLFLGSALGLLASPLAAAISRQWERQADIFSLQLTRDRQAFEATHHRLARSNLADLAPPRLAYLLWFSHPTPAERIVLERALPLTDPDDSGHTEAPHPHLH